MSKLATENWHPQYADACVALANYYDQNSLRDEAEKLLIQCLDLFRQDIDTSIDFGKEARASCKELRSDQAFVYFSARSPELAGDRE